MRRFIISEPVFKTETLFVIDCPFQTFSELLKKRYRCEAGEFIGQCGQMFTFTDRTPWRCVWTEKPRMPVVLHEVFHLVTRICQDKCVPIVAHHPNGDTGDETAAYLYEFFAGEVLKKLRK